MKFDIQTLAFILSLTFVTQVIVIFVQYRVNRTYHGIGWWLMGSTLMAIGIIFILSYYNYMYVYNDISARTVVVNATLATISLMTSYKLFFKKEKLISGPANFTASVFLAYGCFLIVRTFFALMLPPMHSYIEQATILRLAFIVPIITSTLWTFGLIIMLNQRLIIENRVEKEKMQQIFNANPDAVLIMRLNDGLFTDANVGFSVMTGYTHAEIIGGHTLNDNLWSNVVEQQIFLTELNEKGICENMEFVFKRKDGSQFIGIISAKIITIYDVPHIISAIHDITKRKQGEEEILYLSYHDQLTGLYNRRFYEEELKRLDTKETYL